MNESRIASDLLSAAARSRLIRPSALYSTAIAAVQAASPAPEVTTEGHKCRKCNGTGSIAMYAHVDSGKCFRCNGTRVEQVETTASKKARATYTQDEGTRKAAVTRIMCAVANADTCRPRLAAKIHSYLQA